MTRLISSELFTRLPHENIQRFFAELEAVEADFGEVIVEQGTPGDFLYIVAEGNCAVTRRAPGSGQELQLAVLKAGDTFGEESLISNSPRNASVKMLSAGFVMRLPKASFEELVGNPTLRALPYSEACQQVERGAVWLDVRFTDEHEANAIEGSLNAPLNVLRSEIPKLDHDKQYVVYCDTGARSSSGAFLLARAGFDASYLAGGLDRTPLSREVPQVADEDDDEDVLTDSPGDDFEFEFVTAADQATAEEVALPAPVDQEPRVADAQSVPEAAELSSPAVAPVTPVVSPPQAKADVADFQARLAKVVGERDKAAVYGRQAAEAARGWKKRFDDQGTALKAEQAKREQAERELANLQADAERAANMELARLTSELESAQRRADDLELERQAALDGFTKERERYEARTKALEGNLKVAVAATAEQESMRLAAEVAFADSLQSTREQLATDRERAKLSEAERDRLQVEMSEVKTRAELAEGSRQSEDSEQQQLLGKATADLELERVRVDADRTRLDEELAKLTESREQFDTALVRDRETLERETQALRERSAALDSREMDLSDHRSSVEADVIRREEVLNATREAFSKEKESWQAQVDSAIADERNRLEKEVEKIKAQTQAAAQIAAQEFAEQKATDVRTEFESRLVEVKAGYEARFAQAKATVQKMRAEFGTQLAEQEALLEDERRRLETESVRLREALSESRRAVKELEEAVALAEAAMVDDESPAEAVTEGELVLELDEPGSDTLEFVSAPDVTPTPQPVVTAQDLSVDLELDEAALAEPDPVPVHTTHAEDLLPTLDIDEDSTRTEHVVGEKAARIISVDQMADIRARMMEKIKASKVKS